MKSKAKKNQFKFNPMIFGAFVFALFILFTYLTRPLFISKNVVKEPEKQTWKLTFEKGTKSTYPNLEGSFLITIKGVSPEIEVLTDPVKKVPLDKFFTRIWYEDKGEMMRKEPLVFELVFTKPKTNEETVYEVRMFDPKYDSRARSVIFRAEEVKVEGKKMLSEMGGSFQKGMIRFDGMRFKNNDYLKEIGVW